MKIKRSEVSLGMVITVTKVIAAYYSGYAGRPVQNLEPGMLGVVHSVDVPKVVARKGESKSFVCVDFIGTDGEVWRAGVEYKDLTTTDKPRPYFSPEQAARLSRKGQHYYDVMGDDAAFKEFLDLMAEDAYATEFRNPLIKAIRAEYLQPLLALNPSVHNMNLMSVEYDLQRWLRDNKGYTYDQLGTMSIRGMMELVNGKEYADLYEDYIKHGPDGYFGTLQCLFNRYRELRGE
jgi:hypothetical protein